VGEESAEVLGLDPPDDDEESHPARMTAPIRPAVRRRTP
jgi:hypothetical protein